MLSMQKLLCTTTQYASSRMYNGTITRYTLRPVGNLAGRRKYSQTVPEKWLVDDKDKEKHKLDRRIKAMSRQLMYCDYIEKRSLRGPDKKVFRRMNQLKLKAKYERQKRLMETPPVSVALKFMRESKDDNSKVESKSCKENADIKMPETSIEESSMLKKSEEQSIHMPYTATDTYETVGNTLNDNENEKISDLNEKYMKLYEEYLAAKESLGMENLEEIINEKTSSEKVAKKQSADESRTIPPNWMTDYEQYDDSLHDSSTLSNYGTPMPGMPVSTVPCGGCGALLHCQDPAIPGYLPSELFKNQPKKDLRSMICQRCHFMKFYNVALNVTVKPDEYSALLGHIKKKKVAVIMMIDLTDFPCSIWPGIMDIISPTTSIFVVGNKVDLLPKDGPKFLMNVEKSLRKSLIEMGIKRINIKHVSLISAKSGYGVESLINKLYDIWAYKGDVYLIGCTNVGKSSLFNALLRSDYCKVQAADLTQRATISPWPGTTLRLLKFPILRPARWRLWQRTQRLIAEREGILGEQEYRKEQFKQTKHIKYASLQGHIGKTFSSSLRIEGDGYFGQLADEATISKGRLGYNENAEVYKNSRWCYDTPGAMLPDQVLHLLTTEELMLTLPRQIISPRSFILESGQSLFLAGLGRLDLNGGLSHIMCTVFASNELPVTICWTSRAKDIYKKLLTTEALAVPKNDPERLKRFPALESKKFEVPGTDMLVSTADIILSSAGWIALTIGQGYTATIEAWTPEGRGIYLRTPAMLSRSVQLKGFRIPNSPKWTRGDQAYKK